MLPRPSRLSSRDLRLLFARDHHKIHAQYLSAHVFFLRDVPVKPPRHRFGVILRRGRYKNSPHMHRLRRLVYAALAPFLADLEKDDTLNPLYCGIIPLQGFEDLSHAERLEAMRHLLSLLRTRTP